MESILHVSNLNLSTIGGLERVESIDILENGVVSIQYTLSDEFMKEFDLHYKHRIMQLDPNQTNENLRVRDFANVMKGVD